MAKKSQIWTHKFSHLNPNRSLKKKDKKDKKTDLGVKVIGRLLLGNHVYGLHGGVPQLLLLLGAPSRVAVVVVVVGRGAGGGVNTAICSQDGLACRAEREGTTLRERERERGGGRRGSRGVPPTLSNTPGDHRRPLIKCAVSELDPLVPNRTKSIAMHFTFTFTFRGIWQTLLSKAKSTFVEGDSNISLWYIKIRLELLLSIHSYEANRTSFIIVKLFYPKKTITVDFITSKKTLYIF